MDYHAVIFDFDGTLADTIPLIVASFNAACSVPLGRKLSHEEVIARFGIPDAAMLRRELHSESEETVTKAIENYFRCYEQQHSMVEIFPGISELLEALQERKIPLAVMTGKGRLAAEISLRQLGWEQVFGSIITGDDVQEQKPHPEGVLRAASELNIAPQQCIFVGDSPADIGAGKAAGMTTIAALWHNFYEDELHTAAPDYWATSTQELSQILGL